MDDEGEKQVTATTLPTGAPALSMRQRILRASAWSLGGHAVSQGIRLGGNLVLTRLLVPEAFGLMAIVYVLMIGFALFSDIGVAQNIVRSPRGNDPVYLNTAWSVQIMRGLWIWGLAILAAIGLAVAAHYGLAPAGTVYADPKLPWVIAVFSVSSAIQGCDSTKFAVARRSMKLRQVTQIELISQIASLVSMVALAWFTRSIWALVAGAIVAAAVRCFLGHFMLEGERNRWCWDRSALDDLLGFGKWMFLSSILGFLVINGDRLMLGGLIDAKKLGLYAVAFLLANTLSVLLGRLLGNVAYPALSETARHRPERLLPTYRKFQLITDALLLSTSGMLIAAGPAIVHLLYDNRYQDAGALLSTLGIGAIGLRYQVLEQCYMVLDRPQLLTLTNALRLVALYAGLPIGFWLGGFQGALWAIVSVQFAGWPVAIWFKSKHGLLDLRSEIAALPALAGGLLVGFVWQHFFGA